MSATGIAGLARERADAAPRRVAAGRIEWKPLAALSDIREAWRELSARALEPNVFYDPAFALPAAPVFGDPGAVLAWSKNGRLIGLFPAQIARRYGVISTLTGWTHPYAPLGVPLVDRDEADAAIAAFLDHAEAIGTLVMLPLVADGPFRSALARVLLRRGGAAESFGTHARAMLVTRTADPDAIAHKKLKELRRQRRRLDEKGAEFASARDPAAIAPALADYLMLEATGWKGQGGTAIRQNGDVLLFVQSAIAALATENRVRIDRLMRGHTPLAASITLTSGDTLWFWKIAYDEAFARYSPGVQLTLDVTADFRADASLARVDSCATADHPMIDHLWRDRLALADLLVAPGAAQLAQWRIARQLETLRRFLIATAKSVRDRTQ